jgi:multicomponent K+:H+ antiporter subunit D
MTAHLVVTPILLPLAVGAVLLFLGPRRRRLEAALAIGCSLALLLNSLALVAMTDAPSGGTFGAAYRLGNWPAMFGIVLVADRLSSLMILLASVLGLVNAVFGLSRWSRLGPYYYALSQFLLMGLNGAFLTGDLFNLFVFFEILLAASYGLLLHGSGGQRVKAGLHYIVVNLTASLLFLIGVSLIFGVTGTLNMAVLAERVAAAPAHTRSLLHAGAAILAIAFLTKAAAWPLGFWLPRSYDAAAPPVAAMFAIMTKVGVYVLLRLGTLLFGPDAGDSAGFGQAWLLAAGGVTMIVGMAGLLAARDLGRLAGYNLVVSAGTLLAAIAFGQWAITAGAILYLVVSTLGAAALFLLTGVIAAERGDEFEADPLLEDYDPADDGLYTEEDETAVVITAPIGVLSAAFLVCTLLVAGMPPLPGFLAKFAMLAPLLASHGTAAAAVIAGLIVASSLCALVALMRAGIRIWWAEPERLSPAIRLTETAPVIALLVLCLVLGVFAQAPSAFAERTARELHDPANYIGGVLGQGAGR